MKRGFKVPLIAGLLLLVGVILLEVGQYRFPKRADAAQRINYLKRVIRQPLEPGSAIWSLRKQNDEFMLFSYAFTAYAATNLAIQDATFQKESVELIRQCIEKAMDERIASTYGVEGALAAADSLPDYSVLYLGHVNLMLGCYRLLSDDDTWNRLHDAVSASLFRRYNEAEFLHLESYRYAIWVPDNTVALASLRLHSAITGSGYDEACRRWVQYAKMHLLEPRTQVLYSTVNAQNGSPKEEPRGSMLGWSIMFIYQFDSEFAVELYERYKQHFSNNFMVFRLFKERYGNSNTSAGDIDSGPVFKGYSIPANAFALSNAILAGDRRTAKKMMRLIHFGAKKKSRNQETWYELRFVDMNISPMAEAIVLFSMTICKWVA